MLLRTGKRLSGLDCELRAIAAALFQRLVMIVIDDVLVPLISAELSRRKPVEEIRKGSAYRGVNHTIHRVAQIALDSLRGSALSVGAMIALQLECDCRD